MRREQSRPHHFERKPGNILRTDPWPYPMRIEPMRRRYFVSLLGSATATWPLGALAQQSAMPVIGFLSSRSPGESAGVVAAFHKGLREAGFVEGQNLAIAFRWAEGRYDRLPALAAEIAGLKVAVIFAAGGPPSALAAKAATSTIPIVSSAASDPVGIGLVASLGRPGGNITGMSTLTTPLGSKGIELLKELMPAARVLAYLTNPTNPSSEGEIKQALAAAGALGIELRVLKASTCLQPSPIRAPLALSSPANHFSTASVNASWHLPGDIAS